MILSAIFKFIMFYFLFVFIKGMFQTYKALKVVKKRQAEMDSTGQQTQWQEPHQESPASNRNSDIIDAEFRVLDENS